MTKPIVSIIMSTYNNALYINKAIDSVLKQSYTDWELIIINDASYDGTEKIVNIYCKKDKRIKLYSNKENCGLVANLIKGISISKGTYIARIDGDDMWIDKNKLKKQVNFLNRNSDYGVVGSWANIIDTLGKKLLETKYPTTDQEIRNYILIENCFFHSSVLIRRTMYDAVGGYNSALQTTEDYNLWLKIGLVSKMHILPEYMINYRINPSGVNSTKYAFQLEETYKVVKDFKKSYPNYDIGLVLWYLRKYVPKRIRILASNILKNNYILGVLRQIKRRLLNFIPA